MCTHVYIHKVLDHVNYPFHDLTDRWRRLCIDKVVKLSIEIGTLIISV